MSSTGKRVGRKKQIPVSDGLSETPSDAAPVEEMEITLPKRAGRKKKVQPTPVISDEHKEDSETLVEPTTEATASTATPKKTRGKKTPNVVAVVGPTGIMGSFLSEQRPLIAHIPVTTEQVEFETAPEMMKYDPTVPDIPRPYDEGHDEFAYLEGVKEGSGVGNEERSSEKQEVTFGISDTNVPPESQTPVLQKQTDPPVTKSKLPNFYSEKLMVLFQDSNRSQVLPTKTEIACFWCCNSFSSPPVAIPSHILDEICYMYGNFCSPECATAYLMREKIDSHVQWERYALLNSLYAEDAEVPVGAPRGIRPAPPREVLRMFGGSMDISEYRAVLHEKRLRIDVLTPPMVSIIQTMDTKPIDFYDQNLKNVFIRNDFQHKYHAPGAQGLRLRRTKPLKSRESTVDWAMKIQTKDEN